MLYGLRCSHVDLKNLSGDTCRRVSHVYMQADSFKTTVCLFWNSLTFVLEVNKMFNKSSHPILLKTNIFPEIWHRKNDAVALIQVSLNCKINVSL